MCKKIKTFKLSHNYTFGKYLKKQVAKMYVIEQSKQYSEIQGKLKKNVRAVESWYYYAEIYITTVFMFCKHFNSVNMK